MPAPRRCFGSRPARSASTSATSSRHWYKAPQSISTTTSTVPEAKPKTSPNCTRRNSPAITPRVARPTQTRCGSSAHLRILAHVAHPAGHPKGLCSCHRRVRHLAPAAPQGRRQRHRSRHPVRVALASACPGAAVFHTIAAALRMPRPVPQNTHTPPSANLSIARDGKDATIPLDLITSKIRRAGARSGMQALNE